MSSEERSAVIRQVLDCLRLGGDLNPEEHLPVLLEGSDEAEWRPLFLGRCLSAMVDLLNDPACPWGDKVTVLRIFCNLSKEPERKQWLYSTFLNLGEDFEQQLSEASSKPVGKFGISPHELVVVTLLRVTNYSMSAADILLYFNNDLAKTCELMVSLFHSVQNCEKEVFVACCVILGTLTMPTTYFNNQGSEGFHETTEFAKTMDVLAEYVVRRSFLAAMVQSLRRRVIMQESNPDDCLTNDEKHTIVRHFGMFVLNLILYTSENGQRLREHVMGSPVTMQLIIPYVRKCMISTDELPFDSAQQRVSCVAVLLRVLIVLTFQSPRLYDKALQNQNFTYEYKSYLLDTAAYLPQAEKNMRVMVSLLLMFNINIDGLYDEPEQCQVCENACAPRPPDSETMVGADAIERSLRDLLGKTSASNIVWIKKMLEREAGGLGLRRSNISYHRAKAILEDLMPRQDASAPLPASSPVKKESIPQYAKCDISGEVMKDPVRSDDGYVFERNTVMNALKENGGICPISGKPLSMESLVEDRDLKIKILDYVITCSKALNDDFELYDWSA